MSSFTINKYLKLVIGGFFALTLAACGQEDSSPLPVAQTSAPAEEAAGDMREGEVPVDLLAVFVCQHRTCQMVNVKVVCEVVYHSNARGSLRALPP